MLNHFTPEDNDREDDYHKLARAKAQEPTDTTDDRQFTIEEISDVIGSMDKRKAPGKTA